MGANGIAERIATEEYHPKPPQERTSPPRNPQPQPTGIQNSSNNRTHFIAAIGGTFTAIALILSVRVLLLLSVIGSFLLGQVAMQNQNPFTLWALGIFCAFTLPVLTYLDIQTRRR